MRNILILLLIPIIASCQALTATASVIGSSAACSSSKKEQSFPKEESRKNIDLSFAIIDGGKEVAFSERSICEYKGSMCGGGTWFEVWHGDQSISHTIPFSNGDELIFWPHGFCITLNDYKNKCLTGNCDTLEHFKMRLMFSEKRSKNTTVGGLDWTKGKFQNRALVTAKELSGYGYDFQKFSIVITDESL